VFFLNLKSLTKTIFIYKMDQFLQFMEENIADKIFFSRKGIIKLGDFLSVQRKGGNGSHITISKTDWEHPGNQLQFKCKPLDIAEHIKENKSIRFCTFKYEF